MKRSSQRRARLIILIKRDSRTHWHTSPRHHFVLIIQLKFSVDQKLISQQPQSWRILKISVSRYSKQLRLRSHWTWRITSPENSEKYSNPRAASWEKRSVAAVSGRKTSFWKPTSSRAISPARTFFFVVSEKVSRCKSNEANAYYFWLRLSRIKSIRRD